MESYVLNLAAAVISKSDREHPADRVLRAMLRAERQLHRGESLRVVRAVFSYFRWRGWLDVQAPLSHQIEDSLQIAEQFAREPQQFPENELADRAIPSWTHQEVDIELPWVRSLQTEPKLWIRARGGQGRALAEKLGGCTNFGAGSLSDTLEYRGEEDLFRKAEFHAGEFEVQDLSSQAVGLICAPHPGDTWWDACAGEGGKTLHLSALMENRGLIWATDRAAFRLQTLKRRAARAKVFNYRTAIWREGPKLPTKTLFDGVLVDAPCSGLGTWQRNPHARWTTDLQDVKELAALQEQLLSRASAAVTPGGSLVYSVCSLARSETVEIAERFEKQSPEFEPIAVRTPLNGDASPQHPTIIWPQDFGGNGMFVAKWKRRA